MIKLPVACSTWAHWEGQCSLISEAGKRLARGNFLFPHVHRNTSGDQHPIV